MGAEGALEVMYVLLFEESSMAQEALLCIKNISELSFPYASFVYAYILNKKRKVY